MKKYPIMLFLLATMLLTSIMLPVAVYSWQTNGVAITTAFGNQTQIKMVSDGAGGAIICWTDERAGATDKNIYAQRIDAQGNKLWSSADVAICVAIGSNQANPELIADGNGGAIIAWTDQRTDSGDIYAQKVNSSGNVQWTLNGVAVCAASGVQDYTQLVSDGQGGAIIAWEDKRYGAISYVFIQHVASSNGAGQWGANGKQVAGGSINKFIADVITDKANGAYILIKNNTANAMNLLFQHIDSTGTAQISGNGTEILDLDLYLSNIKAVHSSDNQIIIVGLNKLTNYDVWASKIDGSGVRQWGTDGVIVCNAEGYQEQVDILPTNTGGALVVWTDNRDGISDIYLQIIGSSGSLSAVNGTALINPPTSRAVSPGLCEDGEGGAFLVWMDNRTELSPNRYDIYYQHLDSTGALDTTLALTGEVLCNAPYTQYLDSTSGSIISNGYKGAIVVWNDLRTDGVTYDIYAGIVGEYPTGGGIPGYSIILIFPTIAIVALLLYKRQLKNIQ
jgi:hypothetical protein